MCVPSSNRPLDDDATNSTVEEHNDVRVPKWGNGFAHVRGTDCLPNGQDNPGHGSGKELDRKSQTQRE